MSRILPFQQILTLFIITCFSLVAIESILAQDEPEPQDFFSNYLSDFGGFNPEVEVLQDDSCSAQIFDIAIARLEGNLVQVEVILDTDWGLDLAAQLPPNNRLYVSIPGRTTNLPVSPNSEGRYVFIVTLDESDSFMLSAYDQCVNMYDTIGSSPSACGTGWVPFDPQFQADFIAFTSNSEGVTVHDWLNNLDYLSPTQRWAIYQSVFADCAEIPLVNGLPPMLSGPYTEPTQECSCSVVRFSRNISPGTVPPHRNGTIGVERFSGYGSHNGPAGQYGYLDFGGGASKSVSSYARDSKGGNNPFTLRRGSGQTNGITRRAELSVGLVCFNGLGQIDHCSCSRDLQVFYEYRSNLETDTEVTFSFSGSKESQAMATDYGGFAATVGNGGDTEVLDFSINTIASACEKRPNEAFFSALGSLIGSITAFNWVTPQGGPNLDSNGVNVSRIDSARIVQQQNQLSTNIGANLGTLLSASPSIATPCESVTSQNGFVATKTMQLTPNEFVKLEMRSGELTQVGGVRSFRSHAIIQSGFAIATFLNSKDEFSTPDWCCTKVAGSWMAGSYVTNFTEADLIGNINAWHNTLPVVPELAISGVGSYVGDFDGPFGCANVEVENLIFKELDNIGKYFVHDISGKVVAEVASRFNLSQLSLKDGFYIITSLSKSGVILKTEKIMSFSGRLQLVSE